MWTGLTLGTGPTIFGIFLVLMFALVTISGWAVVLAFTFFGVFIYTSYFSVQPAFLAVWGLNMMLLVWVHRADLTQKPALRPELFFRRGRFRQ